MTKQLCAVDDCLRGGGVIWTCDRPSLPGSAVFAFGYRHGRQFAVSGADQLLPLLLKLETLGLALGLQSVPERGDCARVIKWRGVRARDETAAALSRSLAAHCREIDADCPEPVLRD